MDHSILQWMGDEALLAEFLAGFSTHTLLLIIVVSLAVLSRGAHWAIDGVVHLARRTKLPHIVIGATIISLGTTTPEAFVSVMAAFMGNPGLALGNGVGSIVADTGLIFGLTCILAVVPMNRYILNRTGWVQVGAATLLVVISIFALITMKGEPMLVRPIGFFLLALLVGYMYITYVWAKKGGALSPESDKEEDIEAMGLLKSLLLIFHFQVAGFCFIVT